MTDEEILKKHYERRYGSQKFENSNLKNTFNIVVTSAMQEARENERSKLAPNSEAIEKAKEALEKIKNGIGLHTPSKRLTNLQMSDIAKEALSLLSKDKTKEVKTNKK